MLVVLTVDVRKGTVLLVKRLVKEVFLCLCARVDLSHSLCILAAGM